MCFLSDRINKIICQTIKNKACKILCFREETGIQSTTMYCERIHFTTNQIGSFHKPFKEIKNMRNFPINI